MRVQTYIYIYLLVISRRRPVDTGGRERAGQAVAQNLKAPRPQTQTLILDIYVEFTLRDCVRHIVTFTCRLLRIMGQLIRDSAFVRRQLALGEQPYGASCLQKLDKYCHVDGDPLTSECFVRWRARP